MDINIIYIHNIPQLESLIRLLYSGKMSLKDGNLTVKDYHTCVKGKQSAFLDATQRMSAQVRTIAVAEPTKHTVQIANEVMEAAIEEYEGIFWTF